MKLYLDHLVFRLFLKIKRLTKKTFAFDWIENKFIRSKKADKTELYSPYNIVKSDIGKGTYIASNSNVFYTSIGKFCSIGPNFISGWGKHPTKKLTTSPYFYSTKKQNGYSIASHNLFNEHENIEIGNDVFIGANVCVLDGIKIGDGAVIGAGAVVSKDIPPYAIAVGVPIKIIDYRFNDKTIESLLKIKWWDWSDSELVLINKYFDDIQGLIDRLEK
ncbi:CatB-related O-acetyltransferase [Formosa algae]|uniref:CatB-related O-acetyltransferase n=1 Tax=Formosa algae TaxID=225843 RepID=UPI000CD2A4E0|nr:CatB-related O-acetyltransferase [Formosa algae]